MNYYAQIEHTSPSDVNMKLPFRAVVSGFVGAGKTNFICTLIAKFCKGEGTFKSIIIVVRDKEPLHTYLESKGITIKVGPPGCVNVEDYDNEGSHHLLVFDEYDHTPLNIRKLETSFIRGRPKNVSVVVASTRLYDMPMIIRGNCSYMFFVGPTHERNISLLLNGLSDVSECQLSGMYMYATRNNNVLTVDFTGSTTSFRKNFLEYLDPYNYRLHYAQQTLAKVLRKLGRMQFKADLEFKIENATREIEQLKSGIDRELIHECCVCCEDTVVFLKCGHPTCSECIGSIVELKKPHKSASCPMCRAPMDYKELYAETFKKLHKLMNDKKYMA
jgi:hypothetical protein